MVCLVWSFLCLPNQSQDLTAGVCLSKRLPQGKWEFCLPLMRHNYYNWCPSCMPLDTLYLVHCLEQCYKAKQQGSLTLAKRRNLSPSPAFCWLYHSFTQMESTRLVVLHAWENCQLSSSWSWDNTVAATRFHHFLWILRYFCALWPTPISVYCG